ncbi:hypothetical protein M422DRAFT_273486 [Sphaerobolus stellatus SS14]|uniref:Uncharacterized protein n=1 Tax=Sphaerobolus stellatus (strain SS14) TaxID=990650 RepID=A0A0C9UJH6_SPHS4|nr:hypothetical protein M422DRAFT_273486 [Sphaerobolus stellatus SS14]
MNSFPVNTDAAQRFELKHQIPNHTLSIAELEIQPLPVVTISTPVTPLHSSERIHGSECLTVY